VMLQTPGGSGWRGGMTRFVGLATKSTLFGSAADTVPVKVIPGQVSDSDPGTNAMRPGSGSVHGKLASAQARKKLNPVAERTRSVGMKRGGAGIIAGAVMEPVPKLILTVSSSPHTGAAGGLT